MEKSIFRGPSICYDAATKRIHARFAHTTLQGLGDDNFRGETDPRKVRLVIATLNAGPVLARRGASGVRVQDVVVRGARAATIVVEDCAGCVDLDTMKESNLARGQLAGWGQPNADLVPLYSPHWNPGAHCDLDLINVVTGEKHNAVTVDALHTRIGSRKHLPTSSRPFFFRSSAPIWSASFSRCPSPPAKTRAARPRARGRA